MIDEICHVLDTLRSIYGNRTYPENTASWEVTPVALFAGLCFLTGCKIVGTSIEVGCNALGKAHQKAVSDAVERVGDGYYTISHRAR